MEIKNSKIVRISFTVLFILLAFSLLIPASAGIPMELQKVRDDPAYKRVSAFLWDYRDYEMNALVWEISPNTIPYIDHWQRVRGLTPDGGLKVGKICKEETPHPYLVIASIEGNEQHLLRYAYPEDTDGDHIPNKIFWGFYHIFEPDDLTEGYYSFNVIFYAGKEKGEWLENFNALQFWQGLLGVESLLIHVTD